MKQPRLFKAERVCCSCGSAAPVPSPGGPRLLSISLQMYRKGTGKGQQRAAGSIVICEDCFARAFGFSIFGGASREGKRFLKAAGESLSRCYNALAGDDCEPGQAEGPARLNGELFA